MSQGEPGNLSWEGISMFQSGENIRRELEGILDIEMLKYL
jgi:hypothetical protein